jgi:hypothetical protein
MDVNELLIKYKNDKPKEYTDSLIEKCYPVSSIIKMFIDYDNFLSDNKNKFVYFSLEEKRNFFESEIYTKVKQKNNGKLKIKRKYLKKALKVLGGDFDKLNKNQRMDFENDVVFNCVRVSKGYIHYI